MGASVNQRHVVCSCLALLGVWFFGVSPAWAHARLERAVPAVGATVGSPPTAVALKFTEPVRVDACHVEVYDADGRQINGGVLEQPKPNELRLPLPPLPSGGHYTVHWTVTSVDGHQVQGSFEFSGSVP
jgi:methionine-rich copper-binding protein CopC